MSAIGPGDWVECVRRPRLGVLVAGALYCTAEIERYPTACRSCGKACPGIRLVGEVNPSAAGWDGHDWWGSCLFRPIYRPKSSIIEQLKQPSPETIRELIAAD
jgi:hypothetical protein